MNERTRAYIYRVLLAVVPIAQSYGIVNEDRAALIVSLIAAAFGGALAVMNTSTDKPLPPPPA